MRLSGGTDVPNQGRGRRTDRVSEFPRCDVGCVTDPKGMKAAANDGHYRAF